MSSSVKTPGAFILRWQFLAPNSRRSDGLCTQAGRLDHSYKSEMRSSFFPLLQRVNTQWEFLPDLFSLAAAETDDGKERNPVSTRGFIAGPKYFFSEAWSSRPGPKIAGHTAGTQETDNAASPTTIPRAKKFKPRLFRIC